MHHLCHKEKEEIIEEEIIEEDLEDKIPEKKNNMELLLEMQC